MTNTGQRLRQMTHAEVVKVSRVLGNHFLQIDGEWVWENDWSDERVAIECGIAGVTASHVARLRKTAFGTPRKARSGDTWLLARIEALEQRVAALEAPPQRAPAPVPFNGRTRARTGT